VEQYTNQNFIMSALDSKIENPFAVSFEHMWQATVLAKRGMLSSGGLHKIVLQLRESTIDVGVCYQGSITISVGEIKTKYGGQTGMPCPQLTL